MVEMSWERWLLLPVRAPRRQRAGGFLEESRNSVKTTAKNAEGRVSVRVMASANPAESSRNTGLFPQIFTSTQHFGTRFEMRSMSTTEGGAATA